jgi:TolA-binding protein
MQSVEVFFIASGLLLLVLAYWLGTREKIEAEPGSVQTAPALSAENAAKLQVSLTELLNEIQTLSRDVTLDLEGKLSELKELLQLADKKREELSSEEVEDMEIREKPAERQAYETDSLDTSNPELQITVEDDEAPPLPPNRYQQIYQLADQGYSLDEIARAVEMGKGEIQLILSLRKKD